MSYPNQKKIKINKPKYGKHGNKEPFLQIGVEAWQNAFKKYAKQPTFFAMYLYLASNADGHDKWLSNKAVTEATGISRSSYFRALAALQADGYIYEDSSGQLNFATNPKKGLRKAVQNWDSDVPREKPKNINGDTAKSHERNAAESPMNKEINNKDSNRKINKTDNAKSLSELKKIISPTGEYIGKHKWLEDDVPNLWQMPRIDRVQAIYSYTEFSEEEAHIIAYSILDDKKRKKTITFADLDALDDDN